MENPALLSASRQPQPMHNERFVLARANVALHAKATNRKFNATGTLYLSNLRIFFVADGSTSRANCDSFDLPLATMIQPAFNQPIFGANNISGASPPLPNSACQGNIKWTLSFNSGGVGTFVPLFFRLFNDIQRCMEEQATTPTAVAVPVDQVQTIVQAAFVDPNDPTQLFLTDTVGVAIASPVPVAVAEHIR